MTAGTTFTGVWISNEPLDWNEGARGEQLLVIEIDLHIGPYEVLNPEVGYREWCVPAAVLNGPDVSVRLMSQSEEDDWLMAKWDYE